jgi:hypothetical protein
VPPWLWMLYVIQVWSRITSPPQCFENLKQTR